MNIARQHAQDRIRRRIERDRLSHDVRISRKTRAPDLVAQPRDDVSEDLVVVEGRLHGIAGRPKEPGGFASRRPSRQLDEEPLRRAARLRGTGQARPVQRDEVGDAHDPSAWIAAGVVPRQDLVRPDAVADPGLRRQASRHGLLEALLLVDEDARQRPRPLVRRVLAAPQQRDQPAVLDAENRGIDRQRRPGEGVELLKTGSLHLAQASGQP